MNYRIKDNSNKTIKLIHLNLHERSIFFIQQHRWAYPEDSTPQSCQRANKNKYILVLIVIYTPKPTKKKRRGEIFINPSRFFAFFIINSWYIKAWLVVWLSFRWWFFRMKWHVVWQFEFIKIFVASSVLCTDLEKGIFFFILRVFPVF